MFPYFIVGGTFGCLMGAIVLLAVEVAWFWKDPNTSDAGRGSARPASKS